MKQVATVLLMIIGLNIWAQNPYTPKVLSMRERAEVIDAWLEERVATVLPDIMRRAGVDMWIIIAREYNEDPVIKTLLPATWQSARRTTMLIAYDNGNNVETFGMSRYNTGELFKTGPTFNISATIVLLITAFLYAYFW